MKNEEVLAKIDELKAQFNDALSQLAGQITGEGEAEGEPMPEGTEAEAGAEGEPVEQERGENMGGRGAVIDSYLKGKPMPQKRMM